jgi:hypothetical protein
MVVKSRDSSVSIELGYGLDDRGSKVRFPAETGIFSLHHSVQNGSGAHPASYPVNTRGSFPGGKAAGAWSWPRTSISCRGQRMGGAVSSLPQYPFMAWCSVKGQEQLLLLRVVIGLSSLSHWTETRGFIQKFPDWSPGARIANGTAPCH